MSLYKTILSYLLFTVILTIAPFWLSQSGHSDLLIAKFWLVFFFLSGLTLIVIITVIMGQQADSEKGAQFFLAATVFKLLACMIFALVFLHKNRVDKYVFVGDFFYVYFLNMGFEVYCLLRNLRNQNLR